MSFIGVDLDRRSLLLGLGAVGAFLAIDLGAVAYANKWIGPQAGLSRETFMEGFRRVYGLHPGFRREPRQGRFGDRSFRQQRQRPRTVESRGLRARSDPCRRAVLAVRRPSDDDRHCRRRRGASGSPSTFPDDTQWRMAMLNLPVFPDNSPQGFYDRLLASKMDPATAKPDPAAMSAFEAAHPESAAAMALIKQHPPTRGFADSTFSSLVTFFFVDEAGVRTPVRWAFVPLQTAVPARQGTTNSLFDALVRQMRSGPLQWRLLLTVGQPDDPLLDATLPWPNDRRTVDAGVLTLDGDRNRPCRQCTRRQLRSPGAARRHRTVRRSTAECTIGGVCGVLSCPHR